MTSGVQACSAAVCCAEAGAVRMPSSNAAVDNDKMWLGRMVFMGQPLWYLAFPSRRCIAGCSGGQERQSSLRALVPEYWPQAVRYGLTAFMSISRGEIYVRGLFGKRCCVTRLPNIWPISAILLPETM